MYHQASLFSVIDRRQNVKPILEKEKSLTSQKTVKAVLRKISCHSSWHLPCFKKSCKLKIQKRLNNMNFEFVRHIVLTIDRTKFRSAKEAFIEISENRGVANLIWNLRRTHKLKVIDWLWVTEFHKDGFNHWHLFIQLEEKKMIGGELLRKYWKYGEWVREDYFKSKKHWNNVAGYFFKKGYFEKGKGYQGELPDWAIEGNLHIRRFGAMEYQRVDLKKRPETITKRKETINMETGEINERKTYKVIFEMCGSTTYVDIDAGYWGVGWLVNIPYKDFCKWRPGKFVNGEDFCVFMTESEAESLIELCEKNRIMRVEEGGDRDDSDNRWRSEISKRS